jgi:hypothetical protein
MSYRNDHDAALHRVDALEGELARLRKEYDAKSRQPAPDVPTKPIRRGWIGIVMVAVVVAAWVYRESRTTTVQPAVPAPVIEQVVVKQKPVAPAPDLRSCANAIEKLSIRLDASNTDPHGATRDGTPRQSVSRIAGTGAGCRAALSAHAKSSGDELFVAWSAAEDQLAGTITRILVYYNDVDPYVLDNYATADQLWREYDAAIVLRDQALARIRF